jgi:hypothetical protein
MKGAGVLGCLGAGVLILMASLTISAQDAAATRVMSAVRAALAPALPFPETDAAGVVPVDGKTEPLWMVRPPEEGSLLIEVLANPLNNANQLRAERAMAQIQENIESAQRRAEAQYERAVSEAKRTGKSQDVDGVTLSDEGVAGAKIDADTHVAIEVAFNQPSYQFDLASGTVPSPSLPRRDAMPGAEYVVTLPSNTYRERAGDGERFREGETFVFLGRVGKPVVKKRGDTSVYELIAEATEPPVAGAVASLVLRFRGNETLTAELLRKTDWNALLELLK